MVEDVDLHQRVEHIRQPYVKKALHFISIYTQYHIL